VAHLPLERLHGGQDCWNLSLEEEVIFSVTEEGDILEKMIILDSE
jgi:hypothetical protein